MSKLRPSIEEFWIGSSVVRINWDNFYDGKTKNIIILGKPENYTAEDITDYIHLKSDVIKLLALRVKEIHKKLRAE